VKRDDLGVLTLYASSVASETSVVAVPRLDGRAILGDVAGGGLEARGQPQPDGAAGPGRRGRRSRRQRQPLGRRRGAARPRPDLVDRDEARRVCDVHHLDKHQTTNGSTTTI